MALKAFKVTNSAHAQGAIALLFYFSLNFALTILNKLVLQKVCC
jgi:hypothetical protein